MNSPRRFFLGTLTAGAFQAFAQQATQRNGDDYWRFVAAQYPLDRNLIYCNAANVCPAPLPVLDRYTKLLDDFQADPSFQNREKFKPMYESARAKLARLLGASADEIALTRNTSEATNTIVQGLDLKPGDEIVLTDHNHPSNLDSWQMRAKRMGLVVKVAATPDDARTPGDLLGAVEKLVTAKTRVISVTHLTSTTGLRFPVEAVVELGRRRSAWVHIDGAQTFGALDIDLHKMGCDSFSGSAHKWPMGPLEAGVLYVREARLPEVWPAIITAGWSGDLKGARKLDVFGQRDDARIAAFEACADFLAMVGVKRIEERTRALTMHLRNRLAESGHEFRGAPELAFSVLKMKPRVKAPQELYDLLWQHHRVATSVTGTGRFAGVRFSPHVYNTMEQMDAIAAAVRKLDA